MAIDQKTRRLQFKAAGVSGKEIVVTGFHGTEELSRLFWFDLDLLSEDTQIDHAKIIGRKVSFAVKFEDDTERPFHGYVSQFSAGSAEDWEVGGHTIQRRQYHARVVPWPWFLTRKSDCRIFSKKTVPQIIEQVFNDAQAAGIPVEWDHGQLDQGQYKTREYCVQYRETDFNFISRLMEEEGIFYYFKHDAEKHTLVLGDGTNAWYECQEKYVTKGDEQGTIDKFDIFRHWEHSFEFRSGKWAQADYDFKSPKHSLLKQEPTKFQADADVKNANLELYDFPAFPDITEGDDDKKQDDSRLTKVRMEEEETGHDVVHASSHYRSFTPGGTFSVGKGVAAFEKVAKFVVTSIQHVAHETTLHETGQSGTGDDYHNSFTCAPASDIFRPARLTPKPVVHGVQTAVIVGPSGEEIWCDDHGRVKVEFFWDREGQKNSQPEQRSCWVRVANNLAGKQWGFVTVPRVGQEVVVEYLEGDPDRPLVVGSVYNGNQKLHYPLTEGDDRDKNKTKTYFITNSSPGGKGYNELMFDDKADNEQVYLHAQKNMDVRVGSNSTERIYGDRHEIIGAEKDGQKTGSLYEQVYKDKHVHIEGNHQEQIDGDMLVLIGPSGGGGGGGGDSDGGGGGAAGGEAAAAGAGGGSSSASSSGSGGGAVGSGNLSVIVTKNRLEKIKGDAGLHVVGNVVQKIDQSLSLKVGASQITKVQQNSVLDAGETIHIKAGMTLILEAAEQLSLKVGGNFIDIGPAGVSIFGTLVNINSGGAAGAGPGGSPDDPQDAQQAAPTQPNLALKGFTGNKSCD